MRYVALYFLIAIAVFVGLTVYWTHGSKGRPPFNWSPKWTDGEIAGFGAVQGVLWPITLLLYVCWGLANTAAWGGERYMALLTRPPKSASIMPEKDPYLVEAERDVERALAWKDL